MKNLERDDEKNFLRLDTSTRKPLSPENLTRELTQVQAHLRELERELENEREVRRGLENDLRRLEMAVQALSTRYVARLDENEEAILKVALSLREQFDEYHRFKSDVQGLAAHVDRWTRRAESLKHLPPVSWARRIRRR